MCVCVCVVCVCVYWWACVCRVCRVLTAVGIWCQATVRVDEFAADQLRVEQLVV